MDFQYYQLRLRRSQGRCRMSDELTKADKKMLKNFKIAGEIVLLEDKKLMEELGQF